MKKIYMFLGIVALVFNLSTFSTSDGSCGTDVSCCGTNVSDLSIEISFNSTLASINHVPPPSLFTAIDYGSVILITGFVYPRGTWATDPNCFVPEGMGCMCGTEVDGEPSFPNSLIGRIVCTGMFFTSPFSLFAGACIPPSVPGAKIGLFFLKIRLGEDDSNTLELRGITLAGFDGSDPATFAVLGGTGIFKNAEGEALEIMIRPNFSGAFNFVIDLNGLKNVPLGKLRKLIGS